MHTGQATERLWNRHFVFWWIGSGLSAFAGALSGIASSFLVLHQTGSAGAMGFNLALTLLPSLLTPFLGAVVDRIPLRVPIVSGALFRAVAELLIGVLALQGEVPLPFIYVTSVLVGLATAFSQPATVGMSARLVPADQLVRATGIMQGTGQALQLAGFLGGGVLVAGFGRGPSLILAGLLFLGFAVLALGIRFPPPRPPQPGETFWATFTAGLAYVRAQPVLIALPLLVLIMNASLAPVELLLPKHLLDLGAGEAGYGLYFGLVLAGMAGTSLVLAARGPKVHAARTSVLGMVGMARGLLALGLTQRPVEMYLLAMPAGLMNALLGNGISVLFQQQVEPAYSARVGSLLTLVGTIGMPLTLLALTPVVDRLTLPSVLTVAGTISLASAVIWWTVLWRAGLWTAHPGVSPGPSGD